MKAKQQLILIILGIIFNIFVADLIFDFVLMYLLINH